MNGLWRLLTIGGVLGIILICLTFAGGAAVYAYFAATLPSADRLEGRVEAQSTKIMDRNGELLYEVFDLDSATGGRRTVVPIDKIPLVLKQATIATEDPTFYTNPGVDLRGILRAIYYDLWYGRIVMGGSTITQQLVKKTLLTPEVTIQRKIYEAILAYQVTQAYPKDKILEFYLNAIFYGNQAYGIEAAAQTYFNKHAQDLTLAEASLLAGVPQAPALYDPCTNVSATLGRQRTVLDLMIDAHYLSPVQADQAAAQADQELKSNTFKQRCARDVLVKAPHFVTYVRQLLENQYGTDVVYSGGLNVTTTIDLKTQQVAEDEARKQIASLTNQHVTNAALVAINPKTGEILAMLGSVDFYNDKIDGQVNVALAQRQPGSSIKPFNYVTAFQKGWNPATVIADVTTHFPIQGHADYVPHNYDNREHGLVPVRTALASSFNIPAVKTLQFATVPGMIDTARAFGITTFKDPSNYGLALTLGGGDVTLLELTSAYGVFANGGVRVPATPFLKITDPSGRVLYDLQKNPPRGTQVVDPRFAYQITSVLSDASARAPAFGAGSSLRLSRTAAAKTGTTDDYRDNWTVGYTPDLVTGVWVGNADNSAMQQVSGISGAAPLWHNFMERILAGTPVHNFSEPPKMKWVEVCNESGLLPTDLCPADHRHTEFFLEELAPTQPDNVWQKVKIDRTNGLVATDTCPPDTIDEKVFTVYPTEARQWAIDHNIPQPPTDMSPNCPNAATPIADGGNAAALNVSFPHERDGLAGVVTIAGTVVMPDFDHYTIQLGFGDDPQNWLQLMYGTNTVQGGDLATWDTTRYPDGPYTIRLAMYDRSGKSFAGRVHATVANAPSTATPRPAATRVPTLTITPPAPSPTRTLLAPTSTIAAPTATVTLAITQTPTSTPVAPTKTPVTPSPTATLKSTPTATATPTTAPVSATATKTKRP